MADPAAIPAITPFPSPCECEAAAPAVAELVLTPVVAVIDGGAEVMLDSEVVAVPEAEELAVDCDPNSLNVHL